jgi:hypothetical protein
LLLPYGFMFKVSKIVATTLNGHMPPLKYPHILPYFKSQKNFIWNPPKNVFETLKNLFQTPPPPTPQTHTWLNPHKTIFQP